MYNAAFRKRNLKTIKPEKNPILEAKVILQRDLLEEQAAIFWDKLFLDKCMSMCDVN